MLTWQLLFISNGELSLSDHLSSVGQKSKAGQEVRMIGIPMDTGVYGGFEQLHGFNDGAELSEYLQETAIQKHHGTVFREYLEKLSNERERIEPIIKTARDDFVKGVLPLSEALEPIA